MCVIIRCWFVVCAEGVQVWHLLVGVGDEALKYVRRHFRKSRFSAR